MAASAIPVRNLGQGEPWQQRRRGHHGLLNHNDEEEEEGLVEEEPKIAQHQRLVRMDGDASNSRWQPATLSRKRSRSDRSATRHDGHKSELSSERGGSRRHQRQSPSCQLSCKQPHHIAPLSSHSTPQLSHRSSFRRDEHPSVLNSSQRRPEAPRRSSFSNRSGRDEARPELSHRDNSGGRYHNSFDSRRHESKNDRMCNNFPPNRSGSFEDRGRRKDCHYDHDFPPPGNRERFDPASRGEREFRNHHREEDYHSSHHERRSIDRNGHHQQRFDRRSATNERGLSPSRFETVNPSSENNYHYHGRDGTPNFLRENQEPRGTEEWRRNHSSSWGGERCRDRSNIGNHSAQRRYESDDNRGNRQDEDWFARGDVGWCTDHGRNRSNLSRGGVDHGYGVDQTNKRFTGDWNSQYEGNYVERERYDRNCEQVRRPGSNTTDRRSADQSYACSREPSRHPTQPSGQQRNSPSASSPVYRRDYGYGEARRRDQRMVGNQNHSESHQANHSAYRQSLHDESSNQIFPQRLARYTDEKLPSMPGERRHEDVNRVERYSRQTVVETGDRRQPSGSTGRRHLEHHISHEPEFDVNGPRHPGDSPRCENYGRKMESGGNVIRSPRPPSDKAGVSSLNDIYGIKDKEMTYPEQVGSQNTEKSSKRSAEDYLLDSPSSRSVPAFSPPKKRFCTETKSYTVTSGKDGVKSVVTVHKEAAHSQVTTLTVGVQANPIQIAPGVVKKKDIEKELTGDGCRPSGKECIRDARTLPSEVVSVLSKVNSKSVSPSISIEKKPAGIPMRWLKPSNKSKKIPKVKASAPNLPSVAHKTAGKGNGSNTSISEIKTGTMSKPQETSSEDIKKSNEMEKKATVPSSPVTNRMVTDSEGGSTVSNNRELLSMLDKKQPPEVPAAIVTKPKRVDREKFRCSPTVMEATHKKKKTETVVVGHNSTSSKTFSSIDFGDEDSDSEEPMLKSDNSSATSESSDDSDTDDEEVMMWASKMFGVPIQSPSFSSEQEPALPTSTNALEGEAIQHDNQLPRKPLKLRLKILPQKNLEPSHQKKLDLDPVKRDQLRKARKKAKKAFRVKKNKVMALMSANHNTTDQQPKLAVRGRPKVKTIRTVVELTPEEKEREEEKARREREEEKRIREEAKPLTAAQIRAILGEDDFQGSSQSNWVRRSVRRPNRALLNSKPMKALVHGLKHNDPDMVVLKMKKYINDPNAPSVVLDAALEALEENSNCEALYIQNFNEGLRDKQVMHLLRILQSPHCKIWCMNIGENYHVETETWEKFTEGLRRTKITHMYASEHTITSEMKDDIRNTIRENRKKHDMHINPENLDVIIQCTHCWWNPINAKSLRPYLTKQGYEHILTDMEAQGLRGSSSSAPTV